MRLILIISIILHIGCSEIKQKTSSHNDRFEVILEADRYLRQKYKQKLKADLQKDTANNEYLEERLIPIKENFKRINEIEKWTSIDKRALKKSNTDGLSTYYFLNNVLLKIITVYIEDTGRKNQEFYIKNDSLSLVYEYESQHKRQITLDSLGIKSNKSLDFFKNDKLETVENRSYFENGVLIRQINNQDCRVPFQKSYLKEEEIRLKMIFEELKERLGY